MLDGIAPYLRNTNGKTQLVKGTHGKIRTHKEQIAKTKVIET